MTASALSLPPLTCANAVPSTTRSTCPPSKSVTAAAPPLYGTLIRSTPAIARSSSTAKWGGAPEPGVPTVIFPGLARARASTSSSVLSGDFRFAVTRMETEVTRLMGARSTCGLYGSDGFDNAAITSEPRSPITSVYPSAGDFAAIAMPIEPAAPPRLSTTTGCPRRSDSFCANVRPTMSVLPPGGYGTMNRIGFEG